MSALPADAYDSDEPVHGLVAANRCARAGLAPNAVPAYADLLDAQHAAFLAHLDAHRLPQPGTPAPATITLHAYLQLLTATAVCADTGARALAAAALRDLGQVVTDPDPDLVGLPSPLTVIAVRRSGRAGAVLTMAVPHRLRRRFAGLAGQHVQVHVTVGGVVLRRSYSVVTPPDRALEGRLQLGVRAEPDGLVSTRLVERTAVGDVLMVSPPAGAMVAPTTDGHQLLLIAGGSGVTPLAAIATHVLEQHPATTVRMLVVDRTGADVMLADVLDALSGRHGARFAWTAIPTRAHSDASTSRRPDAQDLVRAHDVLAPSVARGPARTHRPDLAYLCTPTGLLATSREAARLLGVPERDVHLESFAAGGRSAPRPRPGGTVDVAVGDATTTVEVRPGESLLSAALRAGLPLPYSCLSGSCGTCAVRVTAGNVGPAAPDVLGEDAAAVGYVLACQAAP